LLAGSVDAEKTYLEVIRPEKLRLQLEYVQRRSFWTDLRILVETVDTILLRKRPAALSIRMEKK
jgi:lipopolysaccharide/colanic/teichoic acid biosynthesis glycosyltransferase